MSAVSRTALFRLVFLVFLCSCFSQSNQRAVDHENSVSLNHRKLFHDLISGKGLYASTDHVTILDNNNFNTSVIQNPNQAWVVEFYNSWCGHCIRYSSTWKNFAQNIYNWRDIVKVAAVDCSSEINGQLCRDYEVMAYPTLRYFPPNSAFGFYGSDLKRMFSIEDLRHHVIEAIEKSVYEDKGSASWPNLKATENLTEVLSELASEIKYVAIMFDSLKSFAGTELILDFHNVKELKVLSVVDTNEEYVTKYDVKDFPSLHIQQQGASKLTLLPVKNTTREYFFNATKQYLVKRGIQVKDLEYSNETMEEVNPNQIFDIISEEKALSDDKVYQLDLEMALRHTLFHELKIRKVFDGEALVALQKFLRVMARYFPLDPAGKELLQQFNNAIWNHKGPLTIDQYNEYIQPFESRVKKYLLNPGGYMNCAQSFGKPPCSLWLLFHTLTVQAHSKHLEHGDLEPQDVLNSIHGYVKHFFGCTDCSEHFQSMAVSISSAVNSFNNSILWLWRAHNQVNARLRNDSVPGRLKIQFPSSLNCPSCRSGNDWNEEEVLNHLKSIYTKISYHPLVKPEAGKKGTASPSHRMNDAASNDEMGYREEILISPTNFNVFDISMCVFLYVFSVVVLVLICIKFLVKKNGRKKNIPFYDILSSRV